MNPAPPHCPTCGLFAPCPTCSRVRLGVVKGLVDTALGTVSTEHAEELAARADRAEAALSGLLARIDSEPTMSGHLTGMRLRPDYEGHETSDAIRAARAVLS